jgi:hypothetical protein
MNKENYLKKIVIGVAVFKASVDAKLIQSEDIA